MITGPTRVSEMIHSTSISCPVAKDSFGLAAIQILLDYLRRHNYTIFAVYRVVLAVIIVILIVADVLPATFG